MGGAELPGATVLGPGRRWRVVDGGRLGVGGLDLERAGPHYLDSARRDRPLEQLDPAPRPDDLGVHLELSDRHRSHELVGDARQQQPVARGQPFELAHEQPGRRATVESPWVPRPPAELGRDKTAI